jgi:RNA polymerase sigma-70 factor (ECF subfamily)
VTSIERHWEGARVVRRAESEEGTPGDAALLQSGRAGDPRALEALVARYKGPLFGLCYGVLGHVEDAEDAVQESFLRALRGLSGFRGEASFRTWLFRIALNVCLNAKRSCRGAEGALPETAPSPEKIALRHLQVWEALATLLPRQRAILLLKEREGWSLTEIGAALRWKRKRVEHELSRARHALAAWRQQHPEEGDEA